jgi:hypothetical protein
MTDGFTFRSIWAIFIYLGAWAPGYAIAQRVIAPDPKLTIPVIEKRIMKEYADCAVLVDIARHSAFPEKVLRSSNHRLKPEVIEFVSENEVALRRLIGSHIELRRKFRGAYSFLHQLYFDKKNTERDFVHDLQSLYGRINISYRYNESLDHYFDRLSLCTDIAKFLPDSKDLRREQVTAAFYHGVGLAVSGSERIRLGGFDHADLFRIGLFAWEVDGYFNWLSSVEGSRDVVEEIMREKGYRR